MFVQVKVEYSFPYLENAYFYEKIEMDDHTMHTGIPKRYLDVMLIDERTNEWTGENDSYIYTLPKHT